MLATRLNQLSQLSRPERRLLIQATLLLPLVHAGLLLLGYARLRRLLEGLAPLKSIDPSPAEVESVQRAREIARVVSIAAQHGFYRATCLRRSLLTWWLLRSDGLESQICFGVRLSKEGFEAHAWVEVNKIVINDSPEVHDQYLVLRDVPPTILSDL
jgi:hypothetical protein